MQGTTGRDIPWAVHVEAWQVYDAIGYGSGQSAERIAERGGFGWGELARMLAGRNPWSTSGWEPLTEAQRCRLAALRERGAEA